MAFKPEHKPVTDIPHLKGEIRDLEKQIEKFEGFTKKLLDKKENPTQYVDNIARLRKELDEKQSHLARLSGRDGGITKDMRAKLTVQRFDQARLNRGPEENPGWYRLLKVVAFLVVFGGAAWWMYRHW